MNIPKYWSSIIKHCYCFPYCRKRKLETHRSLFRSPGYTCNAWTAWTLRIFKSSAQKHVMKANTIVTVFG